MNPLTLLAALLFVVALGFIAATLGILYRHAIPRSPRLFHYLTAPPGLILSVASLLLAYQFLTGEDALFGVGRNFYAIVIIGSLAFWIWALNAYAVYHHVFRTSVGRWESGANHRLDEAAREAEDRFSEGELEKREVRFRLDEAEVVRRGELDDAKKGLEEKLDEIIALLLDQRRW